MTTATTKAHTHTHSQQYVGLNCASSYIDQIIITYLAYDANFNVQFRVWRMHSLQQWFQDNRKSILNARAHSMRHRHSYFVWCWLCTVHFTNDLVTGHSEFRKLFIYTNLCMRRLQVSYSQQWSRSRCIMHSAPLNNWYSWWYVFDGKWLKMERNIRQHHKSSGLVFPIGQQNMRYESGTEQLCNSTV